MLFYFKYRFVDLRGKHSNHFRLFYCFFTMEAVITSYQKQSNNALA